MFAEVVCKRGVKVVDSVKVKPKARVKDSMTPEEAAKAAWDDLSDDDKIAKFNEWASENDPNYVAYDNELFSSPSDAVRAAYYGDEYMVSNGHGNLDSYIDVVSDYIDDIEALFMDAIIEWMVSNEDFGDYEDEVNGDEDEVE